MKKRLLLIGMSICLMLQTTGCGNTVPGEMKFGGKEITETPARTSISDEERIMKDGVNHFGLSMYDEMDGEENCFYSPYSLCSALSMLDLAAGGKTREELETMLGISDAEIWKLEMQEYLEKKWSEKTFLKTANSIWLDENKKWSDIMEGKLVAPAREFFHSEVYRADFKDASTIDDVNAWVSDKTEGMIPELAQKMPEGAVMILMNAVYFEGKWEKPFLEDDTYEDTFYGRSGETTVDMMHQYDEYYRYYNDGSIMALSMPYKDGSATMKVLIPAGEDYIGDLFSDLSVEERQQLLDDIDESGREEINCIQLPKFTLEESVDDMDRILQDMGIKTAYLPNADFDIMADDVYVNTVIHKAKLIVDAEGTKAAAVTGIVANDACAMPGEPINFIVDKPFICVIEDADTGMILFMGQINDL